MNAQIDIQPVSMIREESRDANGDTLRTVKVDLIFAQIETKDPSGMSCP